MNEPSVEILTPAVRAHHPLTAWNVLIVKDGGIVTDRRTEIARDV